MRKKGSKNSMKKKNNLSKLLNKNIATDKTIQTKYHHLNKKVRDLLRVQGIDAEKTEFVDNPNETKMSAVIIELAEP